MTPRVQGLLDDWSKHPLGTADAARMQQACEVRMKHHQELFNFYAVKSDARLKFLTAQRDQRMMDREVNRILKLDRPIAFGDGSDGFSPNGKPGGPVKRFMRHLQRKGGRVVQDFKVLLAVRRRDRSLQDEARADGSQEVEGKDGRARQAGLPAKQLRDSWVAHM